ncbi:MAG: hypothetical protein A3F09_01540 [Chlamydiae bacterium RIFCSPHIGHO2_12_FULL_49_11]|nr:MAG: hypothetical protein A3F09_01540 [Chlamydiae bacterium RIFCSPHIGHO2_12_FULL_49_11]
MKQPKYPLEQVYAIKEKRLEEAEKKLRLAKETYERECKRLEECKESYNKAKAFKNQKIRTYLDELQEGLNTLEIERHLKYIKNVVDEEVKREKKKVDDQQIVVNEAHAKVIEARAERKRCELEMEKLRLHQKEWVKEANLEIERKEQSEADEIGSNVHEMRKRREKNN